MLARHRSGTTAKRCVRCLPVSVGRLREHARKHLPTAMVPARFIEMLSLPLSLNGKVDRQRLTSYEEPRAVEGNSKESSGAMSGIEKRLRIRWQEVLGLASINPDESFFDLGGTSLK